MGEKFKKKLNNKSKYIYYVLYFVIIIWIIISMFNLGFYFKYLENDFTLKLGNRTLTTLKIVDWIIFIPVIPFIFLMIIQIYKEYKAKKIGKAKKIKDRNSKKDFKFIFIIIFFISIIMQYSILRIFPTLKNLHIVLIMLMMIYAYIVLPFLWIKKNGYKKAILLISLVLLLILITGLNTKYYFDQERSSIIILLFHIVIRVIEQMYLYFLVEFFLKKKKTIHTLNKFIIFMTIAIEIDIFLNSIIQLKPEILSTNIIIKLVFSAMFYYIKKNFWDLKNEVQEILEKQEHLIITEKSDTWKKLKSSFKNLKKKNKKLYKNLKFKFLEYESLLVELDNKNLEQSEILISICEYNKLFKRDNFRIFVFDVDNLEAEEKYKEKFNSHNYCKLINNVYVIKYSIDKNIERANKRCFLDRLLNKNKKIIKTDNEEFFDILNKIFEENNI